MTEVAGIPTWLLAELTYACPLQCPYCSNPMDFAATRKELTTAQWIDVFQQARKLGAVQLGLSGGEPAVRQDLEDLVTEAKRLGFYTNLITSGAGLNTERIASLKRAGLDHIQLSFQGVDEQTSRQYAGTDLFQHKLDIATAIKSNDYPMVLNFVLHQGNIEQTGQFLELAKALSADYVELANAQYYGWAYENRYRLLPSASQIEAAKAVTDTFRAQHTSPKVFFVVPDYFRDRPKACAGGWGSHMMAVTPDGRVLPCQNAVVLPFEEWPSVLTDTLASIWQHSALFNAFRGDAWMKEPCTSCDEQLLDKGGCRCQAFMLTGKADATDPVCAKSPHRQQIDQTLIARDTAANSSHPLLFRNSSNSKKYLQHHAATQS